MIDQKAIDFLDKIKSPKFTYEDFLKLVNSQLTTSEFVSDKRISLPKNDVVPLDIIRLRFKRFPVGNLEFFSLIAFPKDVDIRNVDPARFQKRADLFQLIANNPLRKFVEEWLNHLYVESLKSIRESNREIYFRFFEKTLLIVLSNLYDWLYNSYRNEHYSSNLPTSLLEFERAIFWISPKFNDLSPKRVETLTTYLSTWRLDRSRPSKYLVIDLFGKIVQRRGAMHGDMKEWNAEAGIFDRAIALCEAYDSGLEDFSLHSKMEIFI